MEVLHLAWLFATFSISTCVKALIYLYCRSLAQGNASCAALCVDHRNDIIQNLTGLLGLVLVYYIHPLWDDITGILITLYILVVWSSAVYRQARALSGHTASTRVLNQLIFYILNFHHGISSIRGLKAYTVGGGYSVEIGVSFFPAIEEKSRARICHFLKDSLLAQTRIPVACVHIIEESHQGDDFKKKNHKSKKVLRALKGW